MCLAKSIQPELVTVQHICRQTRTLGELYELLVVMDTRAALCRAPSTLNLVKVDIVVGALWMASIQLSPRTTIILSIVESQRKISSTSSGDSCESMGEEAMAASGILAVFGNRYRDGGKRREINGYQKAVGE